MSRRYARFAELLKGGHGRLRRLQAGGRLTPLDVVLVGGFSLLPRPRGDIDPEIISLCQQIIESQTKEINQMKQILERY